jgi:hypothetical protein
MPVATYPALFFTVALLVTTAYFLLGGLPLLVLKHDTPLDSGFIRGFFNVYYFAAIVTAAGTSISYAFFGRLDFAIGAGAMAIAAAVLRRLVLPKLDQLRVQILTNDASAIRRFRTIHLALLLGNLVQLALVVWSLTTLSL